MNVVAASLVALSIASTALPPPQASTEPTPHEQAAEQTRQPHAVATSGEVSGDERAPKGDEPRGVYKAVAYLSGLGLMEYLTFALVVIGTVAVVLTANGKIHLTTRALFEAVPALPDRHGGITERVHHGTGARSMVGDTIIHQDPPRFTMRFEPSGPPNWTRYT